MKTKIYRTTITGESFMLTEMKKIASLKANGFSVKDIRTYVREKNIFNSHNEIVSVKKLSIILKRLKTMDDYLIAAIFNDQLGDSRIVNLWSIYKSAKIINEFFDECVRYLVVSDRPFLTGKDVDNFVLTKKKTVKDLELWSTETFKKLKRILNMYLFESGIMIDRKTGELAVPVIRERLIKHFIEIREEDFIHSIGIDYRKRA